MKAFIDELQKVLRYAHPELIEKDVLLHKMLTTMAKEEHFQNRFIFKGGTCLIKAYLGYFRFSEDLDFTWADQSEFIGKSGMDIRKLLSKRIGELGHIFKSMSDEVGFDFENKKTNKRYFEYGGSGRTTTFKVWYISEILGVESFFKIQVNFVENILYPIKKVKLASLASDIGAKDLEKLFPQEMTVYSQSIRVPCYDIREIMIEKARAILTRRGYKARDFVDIHLIEEITGERVGNYKKEILEKTQYTFDNYDKYYKNFLAKKELLEEGQLFQWGNEKALLLRHLDEEKFYRFLDGFHEVLLEIVQDLGKA